MEFNQKALSLPVSGSNREAFELFRQQCQAEYYLRGGERIHLSDKVRLCIQSAKGKISLPEISDQLHMNERSLRRQLHKEGVTFRDIKQDYLFHRAIAFLQDLTISIEDVSDTLGYSETCAFTRAFQRRTGISPSSYRKTHFQ